MKYETRETVFYHIFNLEKTVENTTRSGIFLTLFQVFENAMARRVEWLILCIRCWKIKMEF